MTSLFPVRYNANLDPVTKTVFSAAFGDSDDDTRVAAACAGIRRFDTTFRPFGVLALMLWRHVENEDPTPDDMKIVIGFYDLNGYGKIESPELEVLLEGVTPADLAAKVGYAGISPLQRDKTALLLWYPTEDADPPGSVIAAYVRENVDTTGGNRRTISEIRTLEPGLAVTSLCPLSRTPELYFLASFGGTSAATFETGYWDFSGNPDDGHTITINSVNATAKDSPTEATDFQRGANLADSLSNAADTFNALTTGIYSLFNWTVEESNTRLRATAKVAGAWEDHPTIAASDATPSGEAMTGGEDADPHVALYRLNLTITGWPESPTASDLIEIEEIWVKEFTANAWNSRPDTCLDLQHAPVFTGAENRIVALVGDRVEGAVGLSVSNPTLVVMDTDGELLLTHEFGFGLAHGMCMNDDGEVYVTATQDIMNGGDKLICKYDSRAGDLQFGQRLASVHHGDNGLGADYEDPHQTRVLRPIWKGDHLLVQDHGTTQTTIYVYDRNLNFIRKYASSTASPTYGPREIMDKRSVVWFAEAH
jgi:hypothetical protein